MKDQIIYKTNEALLTSVAVKQVGDSIVVFLGTSNGHLKKVIFTRGQLTGNSP